MKYRVIGTTDRGIDGSDHYYLLTLDEKDPKFDDPALALSLVQETFLQHVYQESSGPGTRYCTSVLVSPKQYSETEFIGIAQVRYDA